MALAIEQNKLKISRKDLINACCRAIYLWEFGDDTVDIKHRVSDKYLMQYFGGIWTRYERKKRTNVLYSRNEISKLIYNCQVRLSQLKNPQLPQISTYLCTASVTDKHKYVLETPIRHRSRWEYGKNFTKDLAKVLNVSSATGKVIAGAGDQRALASRVLFFAMPKIHCYNISDPLSKKLTKHYGLQADNLEAVYEKMNELFLNNVDELSKLPRPKFNKLNGLAAAIKDGDWWERRVLDLAVLQNWK